VTLLRSGECSSLLQAIKQVNSRLRLNPESVRRQYYRMQKRLGQPPPLPSRRALTNEEEDVIAGWILGFAAWSAPLTPSRVLRSVNRVFGKTLTLHWFSGFLKRHRHLLRYRQARPIQTARLRGWAPESVQQWIEIHNHFTHHHHIPPHARLNIDETRLVPKSTHKVLTAATSHKSNRRLSRTKCAATLVPVIAADGTVLVSFIILRSDKEERLKFTKIPSFRRTHPAWPHYFATTKTGYTNRTLWIRMLNIVTDVWQRHHPGLHCVIYMDNCSPHRSDKSSTLESDFILQLHKKGIHCFFLPPNTTAWLQPLDDVSFGTLKLLLGRAHADRCFEAAVSEDADGRLDLQDAVDVEYRAFSKQTILKSWYNTGMARPGNGRELDPRKIIELARRNYGTEKGRQKSIVAAAQKLTLDTLAQVSKRVRSARAQVTLDMDTSFTPEQLEAKLLQQELLRQEQEEGRSQLRAEEAAARQAKRIQREQAREQAIEAKRQKQAEREEQRTRKRLLREQEAVDRQRKYHCLACPKRWKGGSKWLECETCDMASICGGCPGGQAAMKEHERKCRAANRQKRRAR
jgi:hypothetical protein